MRCLILAKEARPQRPVWLMVLCLLAGLSTLTLGQSTVVTLVASDPSGLSSVTLQVDGVNQPLTATPQSDGSTRYQATVTVTHGGTTPLTATATDRLGNTATTTAQLSVPDPSDTTPPTVSIDSPADGADAPARVDIVGSVSDAHLDRIAAHCDSCSLWCSSTSRTARSWTSGENFGGLLMTPSSQRIGPPVKPVRFNPDGRLRLREEKKVVA